MKQDIMVARTLTRRSQRMLLVLAALVLTLVIARVAAAWVLERYVNNKLDESPEYAGQIGDIDLSVLEGSYAIENVEITKTEGDVPVPLFAATRAEFSIIWSALARGTAVGQAELFDPQINLVDSNDESRKQTGQGGNWLQMIDDLFPLQIDRTIVHNGQLHFRNYDSEPKIDINLSQLDLVAENLAGKQALTDSRIAHVELSARAMESSDLTATAAFDPIADKPEFDASIRLLGLPIRQLDNFISSYAPFDIEAGTLDVVSELAAREGMLEGYVRPTVHDLDIFKWSEDIGNDGDNPVRALWEGLVGFTAQLLESGPRDELVSNIHLKGDISAAGTNVFVASAGVLKNAFAETYQANLHNTISLLATEEPEPVALPPPLEGKTL
jgi:hypothetical protein